MAFRVVVLVSGTGTLLQSLIDNLPEQVSICLLYTSDAADE